MEIGSNFSSAFDYIVRILSWFFTMLDSITIGGVSLFVINLSLTIFLIVITATIAVVRSGSVGSVGSVDKAKRESYETYAENRSRSESYSARYEGK